jgi:hypothetical protein
MASDGGESSHVRVSVVLPVRNGADFLEQALGSVLSQTLTQLELIVVDDHSTDATPEIVSATARRDDRVRMLRCEGSGVVAALNQGCAAARSPYVARLDADDVALPERLERQAALLDGHPDVGLVGGAYIAIDALGRRGAAYQTPTDDAVLRTRLARYNVFAHSTATFRRDAFEQTVGYRLAEAEDYDLWLRISERWLLACVSTPVLEYRQHAGQVSLVRAREQALATLAARAAAERRRAGLPDPLEDAHRATPELLELLGMPAQEVERAVAENNVRWATTLTELSDPAGAAELLAAAAAPASPYTPRQVHARHSLGRAANAYRRGMRLQAASLLVRAAATEPGAVTAGLRSALARRRAEHP